MKKHSNTIIRKVVYLLFSVTPCCSFIASDARADDGRYKQIEVTYIGQSHNLLLLKVQGDNVYHRLPKQKSRSLKVPGDAPKKTYADTAYNRGMYVSR